MRRAAFGFIGFLTAASAVAQDAPQAEASADVAAITEQFNIDRSDRMTVQVRVNGSEAVPFIVDTGAERTVIANDFARKLALEAGPTLTLATISGRYQVNSFFIDSISTASVNLLGIEAPALSGPTLELLDCWVLTVLRTAACISISRSRRWM